MNKLILFNMVSLDGFFSGPQGEVDWHIADEEYNLFAIEQLRQVGGLLFGRKTYQMMADFWTSPAAEGEDSVVAELMNSMPKAVCTRTLKSADWTNTRILLGEANDKVRRLKQTADKDFVIFGSGELAGSLIKANLIDEFRLMVNPILLGQGRPMFKPMERPPRLRLIASRAFQSGNVLLSYDLIR